jgi:DNA polymerase-3 subunit epsilon
VSFPAYYKDLAAVAMALHIERPLTFLDCETTGVNAKTDRIVEIAVATVLPDARAFAACTFLVDPGISIPPDASAIHGITNESLKAAHAPTFGTVALGLLQFVRGCDFVGYNARKFDREILAEEFERAGAPDDAKALRTARVLDPYAIFCAKEARDLTAARKFYCNEDHDGAHGAEADMVAAVRILAAQLVRYPDLPRTVDALSAFCERRDPAWVDREGKIIWRNGQACLNVGAQQGTPLRGCDPGFLRWMLNKDFPDDTKAIVRDALRGTFPTAAPAAMERAS